MNTDMIAATVIAVISFVIGFVVHVCLTEWVIIPRVKQETRKENVSQSILAIANDMNSMLSQVSWVITNIADQINNAIIQLKERIENAKW